MQELCLENTQLGDARGSWGPVLALLPLETDGKILNPSYSTQQNTVLNAQRHILYFLRTIPCNLDNLDLLLYIL